ncbi:DEAD/DEAH box helicase [Proteus mirabilis]|uniref:DEAD/DEAH box helicase n=1 Tax=Proteus mirabilis TaxID=584 RepID=UPI00355925D1
MSFQLRPYQRDAVESAKEELKKCVDPILIEAATGAGKSLLVSELAIWLKETSGKKVLCTAPSKELVEQNAEKYRSYGFSCSMYSASVGKKSIAKDVVFGTPGSIVNDLHKFDDKFSAIVIDECLTSDSLIETSEGQIRLDDPKLKDKLIKCIDEESGKIYYHKANKVWNNGTKHVSLIKTTEGEIKCTENHLLHSKDSWIYSKDVKIGQSLTLDGSKDFVMKKLLRAFVDVAKRLMF